MTVTVTNTTLFHVAAQWFADATQWSRIAQQNGLSDPMIIGTVTLQLPPASGGSQSSTPLQS